MNKTNTYELDLKDLEKVGGGLMLPVVPSPLIPIKLVDILRRRLTN